MDGWKRRIRMVPTTHCAEVSEHPEGALGDGEIAGWRVEVVRYDRSWKMLIRGYLKIYFYFFFYLLHLDFIYAEKGKTCSAASRGQSTLSSLLSECFDVAPEKRSGKVRRRGRRRLCFDFLVFYATSKHSAPENVHVDNRKLSTIGCASQRACAGRSHVSSA